MTLDIEKLRDVFCRSLCANVELHPTQGSERILIETPFTFDDGDVYSLYAEPLPGGGVRLTDCGHTLMQLSYSLDVDNLRGDGNRARLFQRLLAEGGVTDHEGQLVMDSALDDLGTSLFRFGQTVTRIHDITFLSRVRAESTFYDLLKDALVRLVPGDKIEQDYMVPGFPEAPQYPIDYRLDGKTEQVFVFGIPNKDKAQLATIILQHWTQAQIKFGSLLVFAKQEDIPRPVLARLSNVGGEMVSSLDATEDLERKVKKRAA